jgi:hypothetical protein
VAYAHSASRGAFTAVTRRITIAPSRPLMNVDVPARVPPAPVPPGGVDPGAGVSTSFSIAGWALDLASATGAGVDAVQAWAYPVSGAAPVFAGTSIATPRPDVAAFAGSQFVNSGFLIAATLPAGTYDLVVFAHSTVTRTFNNVQVVRITVR